MTLPHPESRVEVAHSKLCGSRAGHQAGQHLVLCHLLVLRLRRFPCQVLLRLQLICRSSDSVLRPAELWKHVHSENHLIFRVWGIYNRVQD